MLTLGMVMRKGGVAKSSSVLNIAAELARRDYRVLAVDLDPQATLTSFAGVDVDRLAPEETILKAIVPELDVFADDALPEPIRTPWGGVDLLPASPDLAGAENTLGQSDALGPNQRLQVALSEYGDEYDFCLVDSGPSLGKLVVNTLVASDYLLVPLGGDVASASGLARLTKTIELVRKYEKPSLEILGAFRTQVRRTKHHDEVGEVLAQQLDGMLLPVAIPLAVAVNDSQAARMSVSQYDAKSAAAIAYRDLTDQILTRLKAKRALPAKTTSRRKVA